MFRGTREELSDPFARRTRVGGSRAVYFTADGADPAGGAAEGDLAEPAEQADPQRQRLIAESRKYRRRAQEAEVALREAQERTLTEEQLGEYRRLKAEQRQRQRAQQDEASRYQKLAAELNDRHARELAEASSRGGRLEAQLRKVVGADRLKSALAGRGVTRVDQAAYLLQRHIRVDLADDGPAVRVVDRTGQPIADATCRGGETITIERFVDAWLASEGAHFLPPSGDTGSGAHAGASAERADIAELEANPAKRFAFIREHGTDEYLRRLGEWKRRHAAKR